MASLSATATVVRPGLARGKTSAPKAQAPKSCAMSGLTGSAPAFLGKPSALSAGIVSAGGARGAGSRSVATMGLFGLGLPELVVIGGVAAVLFGPSKLPELGKSLGKTVKSFQAAANVRTRPHLARPKTRDHRRIPRRACSSCSPSPENKRENVAFPVFEFLASARSIIVLTRGPTNETRRSSKKSSRKAGKPRRPRSPSRSRTARTRRPNERRDASGEKKKMARLFFFLWTTRATWIFQRATFGSRLCAHANPK